MAKSKQKTGKSNDKNGETQTIKKSNLNQEKSIQKRIFFYCFDFAILFFLDFPDFSLIWISLYFCLNFVGFLFGFPEFLFGFPEFVSFD
jgi:hypothetical protein